MWNTANNKYKEKSLYDLFVRGIASELGKYKYKKENNYNQKF